MSSCRSGPRRPGRKWILHAAARLVMSQFSCTGAENVGRGQRPWMQACPRQYSLHSQPSADASVSVPQLDSCVERHFKHLPLHLATPMTIRAARPQVRPFFPFDALQIDLDRDIHHRETKRQKDGGVVPVAASIRERGHNRRRS